MKRRMRRLGGLAMAAVLTAGLALNVNAVTLDDAQQKADELEEQKDAVEAEKASLAEQLDSIIKNMEDTKAKLDAKKAEVEDVENELESGGNQLFEVLMESENMGDFLNKAEYVSQISEYDRSELIRYQDTVEEVEEKEEEIQAEYKELNTLQTDLITQQEEVQALIDSNEAELAEIQDKINENAVLLAQLKAQAEEEARVQQEMQNGTSWIQGGPNVVSGNGFFTHPCPGYRYQSSYFGEVRDFDPVPHKGHDYAADAGTPTYAAAAGRVTIAGWSSSAGNWVVIDHGNGLVTKYMHHSALCVTAGQYVEKGQQIGAVGTTGYSTGNHLHFQVELNGVAVNPDLYM